MQSSMAYSSATRDGRAAVVGSVEPICTMATSEVVGGPGPAREPITVGVGHEPVGVLVVLVDANAVEAHSSAP